MMKYNNKTTIIITVSFICILGIAVFANLKNKKININQVQINQISDEKIVFDRDSYEQAPRQYLLKYMKSVQISDYDKEFSSGSLVTKTGEKIYAVYYIPNSPDTFMNKIKENYNHPDNEPGTWRGGIIAFIKKENSFSIIWESKEFFDAAGSFGHLEFKDIDNDGLDEIILTVGQGAKLVPALYIYKWNGVEFNLINPNPDTKNESERWMAGYTSELKDVDGDKIFEVVTTNGDDTHQLRNTYKFNGKYYFLWKTEDITGKSIK